VARANALASKISSFLPDKWPALFRLRYLSFLLSFVDQGFLNPIGAGFVPKPLHHHPDLILVVSGFVFYDSIDNPTYLS